MVSFTLPEQIEAGHVDFARQLAATVRDPRVGLWSRVEAARTLAKMGPRAVVAVPDLVAQLPLIHELVQAMRVPVLSLPGFEADDVIATVAKAGAERGLDVFICTSE